MFGYSVGDVVRIGKGKVEYTVCDTQTGGEGFITVQSNNTGKVQDVEWLRLTPVQQHASVEIIEAALTQGEHDVAAISSTPDVGVFLIIDNTEVKESKTFDSAAFAVSRNHTYRNAKIIVNGVVKAERTKVA